MAKILVVDDDVQIRELLRKALTGEGYEVVTVPSLAQALTVLAGEPVDLMVLDLSFPEGSGAAFLKEIRRAKNDVPVVVYSGFVTSEVETELRTAGVTDVLSKLAGITSLVSQISRVVRATARPAAGPAATPEQRTILIVDDEPSIRALLREFFKTKRFRVVEAENGAQAVELVKRETPTAVLLDVSMPEMDGLTTLQKLLEIHPKLGVVMATGQRDDATIEKAVSLGAYGYVLKPFDLLYLELVVLSKLMIAGAPGA